MAHRGNNAHSHAYAHRNGRAAGHYAAYHHPRRYWHHRYAGWNNYYTGGYYNGGTYYNGDPGVVVGGPTYVTSPILRGYRTVLGTIGAVNGNTVTIVPASGDPVAVSLTPSTSITLDSNPASPTQLQQSDRAKVRLDPNGNAINLVALRD
jgi:hypothetical protein